jgi:lipoate-protein ligase A
MEVDALLLENLHPEYGHPCLHIHAWQHPSLTFGCFVNPDVYLDKAALLKEGVDVAKRPTGGGLLFHIWDLSFGFVIPSTHPKVSLKSIENYRVINEIVAEALAPFLVDRSSHLMAISADVGGQASRFCMAQPTRYDLMLDNKKIVGAAQRSKRQGLLHQGTISLFQPDFDWVGSFLKDSQVLLSMQKVTEPLFPGVVLQEEKKELYAAVSRALCRSFDNYFIHK